MFKLVKKDEKSVPNTPYLPQPERKQVLPAIFPLSGRHAGKVYF